MSKIALEGCPDGEFNVLVNFQDDGQLEFSVAENDQAGFTLSNTEAGHLLRMMMSRYPLEALAAIESGRTS